VCHEKNELNDALVVVVVVVVFIALVRLELFI
jgi:hypothetical protein